MSAAPRYLHISCSPFFEPIAYIRHLIVYHTTPRLQHVLYAEIPVFWYGSDLGENPQPTRFQFHYPRNRVNQRHHDECQFEPNIARLLPNLPRPSDLFHRWNNDVEGN